MIVLQGWPLTVTWNHFKPRASRPAGVNYNAQIAPEFKPEDFTVDSSGGSYKVKSLKITVHVRKELSWVVTSKKTPALLNHEQGHVDLLGLIARELRDEVKTQTADSKAELIRQVQNLLAEKGQRASDIDTLYDSLNETDHGRNQSKQDEWDKDINDAKNNNTRIKPDV